MATALGDVVVAQERYYVDHASYAEDADSLALELPDGVVIAVLSGDRRGHLALATHVALPEVCGIAVGAATPIGWSEGAVTCGRPLLPTS
jgi:prolyl-tRNA editing enzyme YbaK/EbsC (Cys-tRNA(Pro) deacylase)